MTEEIKTIREILTNISLTVDEEAKEYRIRSLVNKRMLANLCEAITRIPPYSQEGIQFWYKTLTKREILSIFFLVEMYSENEDNPLIAIESRMTLELIWEALHVCCDINLKVKEEGASYIEVVEETLGFYLDKDTFEKYHMRAHEIMLITVSAKTESITSTSISMN